MKNKKLHIRIMAILILVLSTVFGFSGCKTLTAEEIKSEKVTESEWKKAFSQNSFVGQNFKLEYLYEGERPKGIKTSHREYTGISDGNSEYSKEFVKEYYYVEVTEGDRHYYECEGDYTFVDEELYLERNGELNWRYECENGEWIKNETQGSSIIWTWMMNSAHYSIFKVKYGEVTYDETYSGYVYNKPEIDNDWTSCYVYKFDEEKRLKAVIEERTLTRNGECTQYIKSNMLFTYGKQRVKLPQIS